MWSDNDSREDYHAGKSGHHRNSEAGHHGYSEYKDEMHGTNHGPGCFSATTKVLTNTGWKAICEFSRGDLLVSIEEDSRSLVLSEVTKMKNFGIKNIWELHLENGKTIRTTKHHPFFSAKGWVKAGSLKESDKLLHISEDNYIEEVKIQKVVKNATRLEVFNLYTNPAKNFIVEGIIAHNYNFMLGLRSALSSSKNINEDKHSAQTQ